MTCVHLQQLYKLDEQYNLKLGVSDLIRIVCRQCGAQEVCPSTLTIDYELKQSKPAIDANEPAEALAQ